MKDKEIIEEMAQTMCEFSHSSGKCDCSNSYAPNCTWKDMATSVYNAGYRNCKDKVILSREEYGKNLQTHYFMGQREVEEEYKTIQIPRERKETAEKFVNLPKSKILTVIHDYEEIKVVELNELQELAKEFGVEIKEN